MAAEYTSSVEPSLTFDYFLTHPDALQEHLDGLDDDQWLPTLQRIVHGAFEKSTQIQQQIDEHANAFPALDNLVIYIKSQTAECRKSLNQTHLSAVYSTRKELGKTEKEVRNAYERIRTHVETGWSRFPEDIPREWTRVEDRRPIGSNTLQKIGKIAERVSFDTFLRRAYESREAAIANSNRQWRLSYGVVKAIHEQIIAEPSRSSITPPRPPGLVVGPLPQTPPGFAVGSLPQTPPGFVVGSRPQTPPGFVVGSPPQTTPLRRKRDVAPGERENIEENNNDDDSDEHESHGGNPAYSVPSPTSPKRQRRMSEPRGEDALEDASMDNEAVTNAWVQTQRRGSQSTGLLPSFEPRTIFDHMRESSSNARIFMKKTSGNVYQLLQMEADLEAALNVVADRANSDVQVVVEGDERHWGTMARSMTYSQAEGYLQEIAHAIKAQKINFLESVENLLGDDPVGSLLTSVEDLARRDKVMRDVGYVRIASLEGGRHLEDETRCEDLPVSTEQPQNSPLLPNGPTQDGQHLQDESMQNDHYSPTAAPSEQPRPERDPSQSTIPTARRVIRRIVKLLKTGIFISIPFLLLLLIDRLVANAITIDREKHTPFHGPDAGWRVVYDRPVIPLGGGLLLALPKDMQAPARLIVEKVMLWLEGRAWSSWHWVLLRCAVRTYIERGGAYLMRFLVEGGGSGGTENT